MDFTWETTSEINKALADRVKEIRKRRGYTQKELAQRCNVSYGSLKLFEQTGDISLKSLTKIATELGVVNEIKNLFTKVPYKDISEIK
ncbi:MAG: helix-turn-helix transcriptional regulator [Eubacterium sp.]|nr:helix-turn-helix transcriptional regulator [Eubacterium sp.]